MPDLMHPEGHQATAMWIGTSLRVRGKVYPVCPRLALHLRNSLPIIRIAMSTQTVQFEATPAFREQLQSEAAKLNLSLSAYILYLHARLSGECDPARLDRHVREVFGQHGQLLRRLAK